MKVEILDYFGGDVNHANVARVSYAKEANNYNDEQNEKLINYLVKHGHCYDDQTEVLTSEGFIPWESINYLSKLASINPENREFIGFEQPLDIVKKEVIDNSPS